ncbi:hypothetical protein BFJ67_g18014 [Fusarium oxysporum f. sp. cepae]|nr:hypothetical protein BFJ67_g18014 [Fusarium oxysporum f. sp. cepae]
MCPCNNHNKSLIAQNIANPSIAGIAMPYNKKFLCPQREPAANICKNGQQF